MKKKLKPDIAHRLINHGPCVLITSVDEKGIPNVMTLAWTMVVNSEPSLVAIGMGTGAYSNSLIKKSREFVINIPGEKLLKALISCGSASGRREDKFKKAGLTPAPSCKVKTPQVKECIGHMECRVIDSHQYGDVTVFIGRVVSASVRSDLFDKSWVSQKAKTIHDIGGGWFVISGKRRKP